MRFLIEVGLEDLQHLPEGFRKQIQASLGLPSVQVQQPAPQMFQQPVMQPQMFQAPPVMVPTKQPIIEGNKQTFLADRGHFSQQNIAVDVMTGQPIQIGATPTAPVIPQFNNAPVNVAPVGAPQPQQVAPPMPQVDATSAKALMTRTYNRTDIDGKAILQAVLTETGVGTFANVNSDNAGRVVQGLMQHGVML